MKNEHKSSGKSDSPISLGSFIETSCFIERVPYYLDSLKYRINAIQTRENIGMPFQKDELPSIARVEIVEFEQFLELWKEFRYHSQVIEEYEGALAHASGGIFYMNLDTGSFDQQEIREKDTYYNLIMSTSAHKGAVEWFYNTTRGILSRISRELVSDHSSESVKDRLEVFNWLDSKCYYDPDIEKIAYHKSAVVGEFEEINLQSDCVEMWETLIKRERALVEIEHQESTMGQGQQKAVNHQDQKTKSESDTVENKKYPRITYPTDPNQNTLYRKLVDCIRSVPKGNQTKTVRDFHSEKYGVVDEGRVQSELAQFREWYRPYRYPKKT